MNRVAKGVNRSTTGANRFDKLLVLGLSLYVKSKKFGIPVCHHHQPLEDDFLIKFLRDFKNNLQF